MNNSNTTNNWPEVPIGQTGKVLGGRQRSPHAIGSSQKYLRVANVFDGYIDSSDIYEMPFSEEEAKRFLLEPGDILLNEGQSLELVGRSAIYRGDPPNCCFQNTLVRYRAGPDVLPEFAQYTFQNFLRLGKFAAIASQTTSIAHLGAGRFAALPMPVPPLEEQRAIASALSDMDTLLAKLDQLIAKKRDIKQAAMQELLTGRRRLPGFDKKWERRPLGQMLAERPAYGINAPAAPYSLSLPTYIRITDITDDGKFSSANPASVSHPSWTEYKLSEGDIVLARTGASTGKSYRYKKSDGTLIYAGFLIKIRPDPDLLHPAFLECHLNSTEYWKWVQQTSMRSGQPGINGNEYAGLSIPLPSIDEQTAIASILMGMGEEITALEARREKTRLIKQGMMQELLSGRGRLT